MQTKQSEELRALNLQEMEEVNGGGYAEVACYVGIGFAYAAMIGAAWTGVGLIAGAIAVGGFVTSTSCAS